MALCSLKKQVPQMVG